jgi:hypothetical protein
MQETLAYAMEYYKELTSFHIHPCISVKYFKQNKMFEKKQKKVDEKFFQLFFSKDLKRSFSN